ncbi:MAG: type II toxin-antitoxin system RelE/ParE family toxin [Geobacteraceae bacterium]|nr:type II toxin-antitoxin system RelE/ParE family toxin [Desulfobulbus sp.]
MSKEIVFLGDSREKLRDFPDETKICMGHALRTAQEGGKAFNAKPIKGIGGGATVIEICDNHDGNTYRVMYTVKIGSKLYVLHAFQKKSKKGIETPKPEIEIVKIRLKKAKELALEERI